MSTMERGEDGELNIRFGRGEVFLSAGYREGLPVLVMSTGRGSAPPNTQPFAHLPDEWSRLDLDERDVCLWFENEAGLAAMVAELDNVQFTEEATPRPEEVPPHPLNDPLAPPSQEHTDG